MIINWLSADDVPTVTPELGADIPVAARIFVIPSEDADMCRAIGRRMITAYLNVGVYAEFHRWLGRGDALDGHVATVGGGRPQGGVDAVPDEVVDDLVVHGSFAECRDKIGRYVANGVDIPALAVLPFGVDLAAAVEGLAPR